MALETREYFLVHVPRRHRFDRHQELARRGAAVRSRLRARVDDDAAALEQGAHGGGRRGLRQRRRACDQIALAEDDAEVAHRGEFGLGFDAFGDQVHVAGVGDFVHGLDELELQRVVGDAADEVAVDLDEFGPYLRPDAQVREALAEIVDGELVAELAVDVEHGAQGAEIRDVLVLGKLDDDLARRQADPVEQSLRVAVGEGRVGQAADADVEEQAPGQLPAREFVQYDFAAQALEFGRQAAFPRQAEQGLGRVQRGAGRAADQALEAEVAVGAEVEDRLEHGSEIAPLVELDEGAQVVLRQPGRVGGGRRRAVGGQQQAFQCGSGGHGGGSRRAQAAQAAAAATVRNSMASCSSRRSAPNSIIMSSSAS